MSMNLNIRRSHPAEMNTIIRTIQQCRQSGRLLAGLPYCERKVDSSGIHLEIIVPAGPVQYCRDTIRMALKQGYD